MSKRILIVQLRRVGDVLFTLPAAAALRRNLPDARLDFLVERPSDQFARLSPHLDEVLVYEKDRPWAWIREIRRRKYDWVLDFHANGRTLLLTLLSGAPLRAGFKGPWTRRLAYNVRVESTDQKYIVEQKLDFLRALKLNAGGWGWDLRLPPAETEWAEDYLRKAGALDGKSLVGIAPASRRATRRWPAERFAEVAGRLKRDGCHVLFLWGPGEKDLIDGIADGMDRSAAAGLPAGQQGLTLVPPETSLLQLAALIARCRAVLALDNGPKNTAVALNVPTLTIHGPTNPRSFNPPDDPRHAVIRDEKLFCIGCGLNQCPYKHECMQNLGAEGVLAKFRNLLSALPASA